MGLVKSAVVTGLAGAAWTRREDIKAAGRRLMDRGSDAKRDRSTEQADDRTTADRAPNSPVADVPPR
jgi:hypothetical protein